MIINREIRLASRPLGEPGPENFELAKATVPDAVAGQILVRNTWMSVDPYMRGRMSDAESYMPPFQVGAPLEGSAIGEVITSLAPEIPVGATVSHFLGWREYAVIDAAAATVVDTEYARPQDYLGVLGPTGLTAYVAVTQSAPVEPGDVVFVSGAAGAVGSIAGQIARKLGATKVIGSAGGSRKVKTVVEDFGFDAAIDYRAGSLAERLAQLAPEGIDVYVDNIGGDHLQVAISAMKAHGRASMVA
jgi:NADPH-dependent curcumin reductase CurA